MSAGAQHARTIETLSAALSADRFPSNIAPRAKDLLQRLDSTARITFFGLPQIGKTSVLNLLAGGAAVPEDLDLGTVRVEYGPEHQTSITKEDGKTVTLRSAPDPKKLAGVHPMLTYIRAPLPALLKISLMEINLTGDAHEQARAIKWAVKHTDIAIWCTDGFTPAEAALWQNTPGRLRDHGILLQTRADLLGAQRASAIPRLWEAAGDEFAYALEVSAHEANAAATGGKVDKTMMRASGGMKLISTILKEIEAGRQNMIDQADVLLRMHPEVDVKMVAAQERATVPVAAPVAKTAAAKPAPVKSAVPETVASGAVVIAFQAAADRLAQVGHDLQSKDAPDADTVLDASAHALEWLSQHMEDADLPDLPQVKAARLMAQDAEDLVQLLRIEATDTGSTDAVLALLQLKRGFQAVLAA